MKIASRNQILQVKNIRRRKKTKKFQVLGRVFIPLYQKKEGTFEQPIQIDEICFAGWRKYNCGRMLVKDEPLNSTDDEDEADLLVVSSG